MQGWRDLGKLSREAWVLSLALFINRMGAMAMPFLVLYLTKKEGFLPQEAGSLLAIYGVAGLVVTPVGGWLCDRWGALRVMMLSLVLSGGLLLLYPVVHGFVGLALLTFFWGAVTDAHRPANASLMTHYTASEQRKSAFALNRLAVNLGMSFGPALGGIIAQSSFKALFIIDGLTTLVAALVVRLYFASARAQPSPPIGEIESVFRSLKSSLGDRRFLYFLIASLPVNMVFFQWSSTVPLHLVDELRFSEATYGLLSAINTVIIIFVEIPLNAATASWSHRLALSLGSLVSTLGFGALVFCATPAHVAVTIVIWTFGEMIFFPQCSAYIADIAPERRRGAYMGLYTTSFSLAFVLGPWLGTIVLQYYGASALWLGCLGWGMISTLMFLRKAPTTGFPTN